MFKKFTLLKTHTKNIGYVGILITVLAVVFDFANTFGKFNLITKEESIEMLIAITLSTVMILDVPMYVAGCVLKKYYQNILPKKESYFIIFGGLVAFGVIALLNLWLSIECAPFLLEDPATASSLSIFSSQEPTNSVIAGAIIIGMQPILTSITTFVVGLYCSNPLLSKVTKLEKQHNAILSSLQKERQREAEIAIMEPELYLVTQKFFGLEKLATQVDPQNCQQQLLLLEQLEDLVNSLQNTYRNSTLFTYSIQQYQAAVEAVYAQEHLREQATICALQKKLNTPNQLSALSKYAIDLAENTPLSSMEPINSTLFNN